MGLAGNVDAGCDGGRVLMAQQWCSAGAQGNGVLQRQHLFSVYIHPLPDYGTFPEESIFWGREIEDRIQASMLYCLRACCHTPTHWLHSATAHPLLGAIFHAL